MNNEQIADILSSCAVTKNVFRGVYSIDTLPSDFERNSIYVCNLDTQYQPGSHWITLYIPKDPKDKFEFFDSFGFPAPLDIELQMDQHEYIYWSVPLQHPFSAVCGLYCMFFAHQRPLSDSMYDALSLFDACRPSFNDHLVQFLVEISFDINIEWLTRKY